ncbi:cyclic nucleotide-binding domain-containing protein [Candidatus Peregrinibacteria bacterium]|nr:cyclic nucleotide-binding domain-containing protein [Candidatus Peregrinibacteria bacterium]
MNNKNVDVSVVLPLLKQIPLFSDLNEELHKEIIKKIVLMYYPEKYILFKEGDDGDALYIVKKGTVTIYHEPEEEGETPEKVADIYQGGFFGEMALVSEEPRNASAKTATDCEIFILSKDNFKKLLSTNTTLAEQISATMIVRTNENLKNQ